MEDPTETKTTNISGIRDKKSEPKTMKGLRVAVFPQTNGDHGCVPKNYYLQSWNLWMGTIFLEHNLSPI